MTKLSLLQNYERFNRKYQEISKAPLISDIIAALLITIASVIFKRAFPSLSVDLLIVFSLLALITFLIILRLNKSWILGGTVVLIFLGILVLIFGQKSAPRGGAYIILDYSNNMQSILKGTNISNLFSLAAAQVPDNVDVGFMIAGDPFAGDQNECYRVKEIQPPAPKPTSLPNIQSSTVYLNDFAPQGPSNIENAVIEAINRLAGREDVQEIIVITSGLDESCEILNRSLLNLAAGEKKLQYALTILAVGKQKESDIIRLRHFANKYKEVALAADIPASVSTIIKEPIFSYYSP